MPDQDTPSTFDKDPSASVTTPTVTPEVEQTTNQYDALLASIVNDEGTQKYADVQTALAALAPSQVHIKTMEVELATLREQAGKESVAAELLAEFKKGTAPSTTQTTVPSMNAEQVAGIVEQVVSQKAYATTVEANQAAVNVALVEKFGDVDKAKEAFVNKGVELGLNVQALDKLAGESPTAVLQWFDAKVIKTPQKEHSTINTEQFSTEESTIDIDKAYEGVMGYVTSAQVADAWQASKQRIMNNI